MSAVLPADRVEAFVVTCPASTASSAAVTVKTPFPVGAVQLIRLRIPPGHRGLTGIAFLNSDGQAIPITTASFLIGDDEVFEFPIIGYLDNGNWGCKLFNNDLVAHSWYVTYYINVAAVLDPPTTTALAPPPLLV